MVDVDLPLCRLEKINVLESPNTDGRELVKQNINTKFDI
jgi:hypothetical protein